MLVRQAESAGNQQNFAQPGDYQCQAVASVPDNQTLFVNQAVPFQTAVQGQEEIMDHSGAYDAAQQQVFSASTVDNTQLSQQSMPPADQVLMDISNANPTAGYSFDYNMQGQSFTAQMEQTMMSQPSGFVPPNKQHTVTSPVQSSALTSPAEQPQMMSFSNPQQQQHLLTPLEEIQAQQLANRAGTALSPTQFMGNTDPFNSLRQADASNQPRKGRLPRNVSDSQLYTMDLSQLGTSFQASFFPSMESNLPPQLEAPNLVAHLQSIQPRARVTSTPPAASQPKRARLPRNMSDSRLSSLASMSRSPTSPPSLPTVPSETTKQHSQPTSGSTQTSRLAALKGRKQGRLPRNMSDSSLLNLGQQPQQLPPTATPQRRRKMSDPQHVVSASAVTASLQASVVPSVTFTSSTATQLYNTSSSLQSGDAQLLHQLLSTPAPSNNSSLNVVSSVSTMPQATESFQSVNNSVLGQLLTQQSPAPTAAMQMPAQDTNPAGGNQDPALLAQLLQLKQMLQSKPPSIVPAELVDALNSFTNSGTLQGTQQKQEQTQPVVQQKASPAQPSLQMKPKNQNAITQALQSLLRSPSNVTIQPSTQTKQSTQVSSPSSQSSYQVPSVASQNTQVPSVTIKHQPQGKPSVAAVILTPQGSIQPVQDTHTHQMPELTPAAMPQVVNMNVTPAAVQGQRIILPANVNLSTLSLAQLGLSPATLQSVSVCVDVNKGVQ